MTQLLLQPGAHHCAGVPHDAQVHCAPVGSHLMALTSSLWPSNVLRGCVSPSLQTWIILSVLQVAKEVLFRQSTSSVGAA